MPCLKPQKAEESVILADYYRRKDSKENVVFGFFTLLYQLFNENEAYKPNLNCKI